MGSKTKTVGGGKATPTANAFNDWMLQGLQTGSFGQGPGQAAGQTNAFGSAVNQMLGGQGGIPENMQGWFANAQNGNGGVTNLPSAPNFRETQFAQIPTGPVSGYDQDSFGSLFGKGGAAAGFGPAMASGAGVNFNSGNYARTANAIDPNGGQLLNVDYNANPEMRALADMQNRQKMMDTANVRARFGALGTGLSTGASLAESQYLAEANPRNTLALGELGRQMQGIDMQNRGQNYQALLQQMGIQSGERGQNINADLGAAVASAGNATSASIANAGNANQFGVAQLSAMLQAKGMDADNAFRNATMMANNMQQNNANMFGNNQAFNNFGQQTFAQNSQNALNNQGQMNQFALGQAGIGQGLMGLGQNSQQAMMQMLMNQYGNINQLGTPQAQVVEQQNPWMQGLTALGGLAQGAGSFMTGMGAFKNPMGAGGGGGGFNMPRSIPTQGGFTPTSQWPTQGLPTSLPAGSPWATGSPRWNPGLNNSGSFGQQNGLQANPFGVGTSYNNMMAPQGGFGYAPRAIQPWMG